MKQYKLLALTLGGAFMLGGLAPTIASADSASDIADLKRMVMEMQKSHDAEITKLKQQINNLKKPAQVVDSQGVNVTELKQQVDELQDIQASNEESLMSRVQFHGSISQGYLHSDTGHLIDKETSQKWDNKSFDYNEISLNVSADVSDKLRLGLQFTSRDYINLMNNTVYLDWAIADYAWKDEVGLRAGRLKVPFGFHNEARDVDVARTSILLPSSVYAEVDRQNYNYVDGFGIYGSIDMQKAGVLNYTSVYGDSEVMNEALIPDAPPSSFHVEIEDLWSTQIVWDTPLEGMRLAGTYVQLDALANGSTNMSGMGGSAFTTWNRTYDWESYVLSFDYTWQDLLITAEYQKTKSENNDSVYDAFVPAGTFDLEFDGWYISAQYRFTDWLASEIYYSEYYTDVDDRDGNNAPVDYMAWQKDLSFNARFDLTDHWIFKLGATFKNGVADTGSINTGAIDVANHPDAESDQHWMLYQLKTTVFF